MREPGVDVARHGKTGKVPVLLLCLSPSSGGLESHVRDYGRWLSRQPDARLALALRRGSPLHASLEELGAPMFLADSAPTSFPWRLARALSRFVREHGLAVIHAHDGRDVALASWTARGTGAGLVLTRHMGIGGGKRDPWHYLLYRPVGRVLTVSEWLAEDARRKLPLAPDRIVCVHPGVDRPTQVPPARAMDPTRFTVGMVARILPDKGQHLLVRAAALLRRRSVPIELCFAGQVHDEPYWMALQEDSRHHGVPMRYLGFVTPAYRAYEELDAVVVAGRDEAFGLGTVEAMHMRRPLVAARSGANTEILREDVDGLFFSRDDVGALADQLQRLWVDPSLGQRLADSAAPAAAARFDAETQNAAIWRAVASVAARPPA